jgi:hypothetical protein
MDPAETTERARAIAQLRPLTDTMECAEFAGLGAAREWQHVYGGHLFHPDGSANVVWFHRRFTLGQIMQHPWARGSGTLNPS